MKEIHTPQLRFEEYQEPWIKVKLGSFTDIQSGYAFKSTKMKRKPSRYQIVKMSNVYMGSLDLDRNPSYSELTENIERFKLNQGDTVLTLTGTVGKTDYGYTASIPYDDKLLLNQRLVRLREVPAKSSNYFILNLLKTSKFLYKFYNESKGGTGNQSNVGVKDLSDILVHAPSLPEQQKIASFLSAVDQKIALLTKKRALLEQYKKGVMQKLFSQEIRFKQADGSAFPEWEERNLSSLGSVYNGLTGKTKEHFGTGQPYIQYKQIFDNSAIDKSKFGLVDIGDKEKQNTAKRGDIFFTISSEIPNEIGTASVLLEDIDNLYLNSFCFGYRPMNLDKLNPTFSQFFFRSAYFRRKIIKLAQGSTRYNMSKKEILKLSVSLPCPEEQLKIGRFLTAIQEKIQSLQDQIDTTQQFKKGLLQQMFV